MSQRLSTGIVIRDSYARTPTSAGTAPTAAQKAAATRKANREAARRADEAIAVESLNRCPRAAMSKAKENKVWLDKNGKKRSRAKSNVAEGGSGTRLVSIKRAKTSAQRPVQYDDVQDDCPSGPVTSAHTSGKRNTAVRKVKQLGHASSRKSTAATHGDESIDDEMLDIVKEKDPASSEDNESHYETNGDDDGQAADVSESGSDFSMLEKDEFAPDVPAEEPRWTNVGEAGNESAKDQQSGSEGIEDNDRETFSDSDQELGYARTHGLSKLLKQRRSGVHGLFNTDKGVTNVRPKDRTKITQRERKLQAEQPVWASSENIEARSANTIRDPTTNARHTQVSVSPGPVHSPTHVLAREPKSEPSVETWPKSTVIHVTVHGNLGLNQSSLEVRDVFHRAEELMKLSIIKENAYMDVDTRSKLTFLKDTLIMATLDRGCHEVEGRIREDKEYARTLIEALSTRYSQFRGKFKAAAASKIAAHFKIGASATPENARRVSELLDKKRYIYPTGISVNMARSKPYEHDIIADVISDVLITRRRSFVFDHLDDFRVTWQGDRLLEIPKAVVALAATAVHAALLDYRAAGLQPTEFISDQFYGVYETHMSVLKGIEEQRPGAYHRLMGKLYCDVTGSSGVVTVQADIDEVLGDLDFDNLED
ncbi:hypothetical protein BDY19DRAFT_998831 [Irpex rosettiformis]|uniref:Uncharacterized protein n=1 Tax=Irpex rosettiformis TaxID=378272 RepID=A0ACB8TMA1_9APHY|nr:hypothetical protein BDY19DRAFT_998831 [Irpex rosettiformis]